LKFGTSGIRGVFAEQISVHDILKLSYAVSNVLGNGKYVVGNDTRKSCDLFSTVLTAGLNYTGNDVDYIGVVPTPVLAFTSQNHRYKAGFSVTASHNPPQFCGIKIFDTNGVGLEVVKEREIERALVSNPNITCKGGKMVFNQTAVTDYISKLINKVESSGKRLRILVETTNGATSYVTPIILKQLGHDVISLNSHISHLFLGRNPEPNRENLVYVIDLIRLLDIDLAVIHDGDGDRLVLVTSDGNIVPDYVLSYIVLKMVLSRRRGDVVISINTSSKVEMLARENNCNVTRYRLGKTYEELKRRNGVYATEPSKIVDGSWGYWEDGIYAAASIIQMLSSQNMQLQELLHLVPQTFYQQLNLQVYGYNHERIKQIATKHFASRIVEIQEIDGLRLIFKNGSWLLFRASGTEQKTRIYCESSFEKESVSLLEEGEKILSGIG